MNVTPEGAAEIISHEAIVPYRYKDSVGVDTFGIGHTVGAGEPDPKSIPFGEERPLSEVVQIFRRDLAKFERRVSNAVTVAVQPHEFNALASFDFNTGGVNRAKLTEKLNAGDRAGAAEAFMGWSRPHEIIPRRKKEQMLFRDGTYSSGGKANLYPADSMGRILWSRGRRIDVTETVREVFAANRSEAQATKDQRKATGIGAGGAVSSGAGGVSDPDPATIPIDPAMLRYILIAGGIALIVIAVLYFLRSMRQKREAGAHERKAVVELDSAIEVGEPLPKDENRQPLAKGTE